MDYGVELVSQASLFFHGGGARGGREGRRVCNSERKCVRLPSLQSATRLSKVVPQASISNEELLQRTGCTRESSNRHWKIALLLRIYTAEGFSLAHLPTVTTLQSFASLLQLASQLHI